MKEEIYLKSVTTEKLSKIEVGDWLEGYGDVLSLSERAYIRKYGFLLSKLQIAMNSAHGELNKAEQLNPDNVHISRASSIICDPLADLGMLKMGFKKKEVKKENNNETRKV